MFFLEPRSDQKTHEHLHDLSRILSMHLLHLLVQVSILNQNYEFITIILQFFVA